jgi:hypothetical protein
LRVGVRWLGRGRSRERKPIPAPMRSLLTGTWSLRSHAVSLAWLLRPRGLGAKSADGGLLGVLACMVQACEAAVDSFGGTVPGMVPGPVGLDSREE